MGMAAAGKQVDDFHGIPCARAALSARGCRPPPLRDGPPRQKAPSSSAAHRALRRHCAGSGMKTLRCLQEESDIRSPPPAQTRRRAPRHGFGPGSGRGGTGLLYTHPPPHGSAPPPPGSPRAPSRTDRSTVAVRSDRAQRRSPAEGHGGRGGAKGHLAKGSGWRLGEGEGGGRRAPQHTSSAPLTSGVTESA